MMGSGSGTQAAGKCPIHGPDGVDYTDASLTDQKITAKPNAFYSAMRKDDPVHLDPKLGMYLVSRFEDVQLVLRDPITFSVERGYQEQYAKGYIDEFKEILRRDGGGFFPDAIMSDPPYHTRIRRLLDKAFTAHRVKELEPRIAAIVGDMIDAMAVKGEGDGVADFAVPMTSAIICEQLGFQNTDPQQVVKWSFAITAQIGRMQNREQMQENAKDICELQNFLISQIHDRQKTPREDMISDLVHARAEGDGEPVLTFEETVSLVRALLVAGNETTATALGNLMYILATQPEMTTKLRENLDDDRYMTRFVEELLRIEPPVRGLARMTTKEVELGGAVLPEGSHMLLLYASANDDETEFECPRNFDINRTNLGRHVAFGGGPHRCIGAALARMEIKVAARELVRRLDNIKLAVSADDITYLPTVATRSIAKLPLTFTRRA